MQSVKRLFFANQLENVLLSNNLLYIGNSAFYSCPLNGLILPDCIKYIGAESFKCCRGLTQVIMPSSLLKIGSFACFNGILKYAGSGIFDECSNLKEIHIPKGSLEHYLKMMPFYKDLFVEDE